MQLLLFFIRAVSVELEPVSKVLLDGLYDVESNLAKLRGCQHVMKLIWEEVVVHIIMIIIILLKMIILEVVAHIIMMINDHPDPQNDHLGGGGAQAEDCFQAGKDHRGGGCHHSKVISTFKVQN